MPGRYQRNLHRSYKKRLVKRMCMESFGGGFSVSQLHQGRSAIGTVNVFVAGNGVVAVGMRDDGFFHRLFWVEVKIAVTAIEAVIVYYNKIFEYHSGAAISKNC
jgi:hypothetical protein